MYIIEIPSSSGSTTLLAKLSDVYKECFVLIEGQPQLYPLICLKSSCPKNSQCMLKLAKRAKYIFDKFDKSDLLVLYFTYRNEPDLIRGGVFWRDFREPRFIKINRDGFNSVRKHGNIYELDFPIEVLA